jgi:beta-carotene ketolase (CrtW type)
LSPITRRGLGLAAVILLGWMLSLILLLPLQPSALPPPVLVAAVLVRTVLHTGLFILAHDAMHGLLLPGSPAANRRLGQAALLLYACLPYTTCRLNHALHHSHPGTALDPDHHGAAGPSPLAWYARFMVGYLSLRQMGALVAAWTVLALALLPINPAAASNVLLFCTLPVLLSSLQLFVVGTYLPHRNGTISLDLPHWLSLLSCYHFGYHHEHHAFPWLAWHELPAARCHEPRDSADAGSIALRGWAR